MATRSQVSGLPGITFHPQGLTSQAKLQDDGRDNFTTIHQSMIDLGVSWVDVLKMDIEGEEWVVMLEMLESGMDMPFTQILIGELACARSESACCASPHLAWLSTHGVMVQAVCQFGLVAKCKLVVLFFSFRCCVLLAFHACICARSIPVQNHTIRSRTTVLWNCLLGMGLQTPAMQGQILEIQDVMHYQEFARGL